MPREIAFLIQAAIRTSGPAKVGTSAISSPSYLPSESTLTRSLASQAERAGIVMDHSRPSYRYVNRCAVACDLDRKGSIEMRYQIYRDIVFDPSDMTASYFGPVAKADVLKSFFPKLQKLP